MDTFFERKRFQTVGTARVAYYEEGSGEPLLLLHGCPFSAFIWRKVIPQLSPSFRCIAPDLLGLGDTETLWDADWSLHAQAEMLIGFLNALGLERVHIVGHDHGGALAQLLAAEHPERLSSVVLSNAEAHAVHDPSVLTPELLDGYIRANLSDPHRRAKTRRFLAGQLDPAHSRVTLDLLPGLRHFDRPTLLIWAQDDPHFGPEWAERLRGDIPGVVGLEILPETGHLLMEERPEQFAALVRAFVAGFIPAPAPRS
jgi:pimeloyl-ACP methyl ester carboxylesterase